MMSKSLHLKLKMSRPPCVLYKSSMYFGNSYVSVSAEAYNVNRYKNIWQITQITISPLQFH